MTDERDRDLLADALRQMLHACEAIRDLLPTLDGRGNLSSLGPTDWAAIHLRDFWTAHDEAQRLIDAIPQPALDDLQTLSGKPWDLVTRRTLDAIAKPIGQTRPWNCDPLTPEAAAAEQKAATDAWWALRGHNPWGGLLQDLEARILDLQAIRRKQYQAPPEEAAQAASDAPAPPEEAEKQKQRGRHKWLAEALLLVRDHPEWSDTKIAEQVGKHPSTLSRCDEYQAAAALARRQRSDLPRGYRDADSGALEAYSDDWEMG